MTKLEQIFQAEYGQHRNLALALEAVRVAVLAEEQERAAQRQRMNEAKRRRDNYLKIVKDAGDARRKRPLTDAQIAIVIETSAAVLDVAPEVLCDPGERGWDAFVARQVASLVLRRFGFSYPQIAAAVGCRNHTSALYAVTRGQQKAAVVELAETVFATVDADFRAGKEAA